MFADIGDKRMTMDDTTLQRGSGVALWRQVADRLAADLVEQALPPGTRLPPEVELATRFGVNRHTLRRAVQALADRGLLRAEQGRGTFVIVPPFDLRLGPRVRFREQVDRQSRSGEGRLLAVRRLPAGSPGWEMPAHALGLSDETDLIVAVLIGIVDGTPISYSHHHFDAARFPGFEAAIRASQSITRALQILGVRDYTRRSTRILARLPTAEEAGVLDQSPSMPVLVTEAVNIDTQRQPVEYGVSVLSAERVRIVSMLDDTP